MEFKCNNSLRFQVHYDWYDKKYGDNGIHEKLDFADVEAKVQEFREKFILPMILKEEKEEKSYPFDFLCVEYFIPQSTQLQLRKA